MRNAQSIGRHVVSKLSVRLFFAALAVFGLGTCFSDRADAGLITEQYTGAAHDNNWNDPANWAPPVVPNNNNGSGNTYTAQVFFNNPIIPINITAPVAINNLTLADTIDTTGGSLQVGNLSPGSFVVSNTGLLQALNGNAIDLYNTTVTMPTYAFTPGSASAFFGRIDAMSANVNLDGATIDNGAFSTESTYVVQIQDASGNPTVFNNVTSLGVVQLAGNASLNLEGTMENAGVISLPGAATIYVGSGAGGDTVNLNGVGSYNGTPTYAAFVTMADQSDVITGASGHASETLAVGEGEAINGEGSITSLAQLNNAGTINANVSGQTLTIQNLANVTNTGTMEASGSTSSNIFGLPILSLKGLAINNTGGTISASGGYVSVVSTVISGGTISTTGSNSLIVLSGLSELDGDSQGSLTNNGLIQGSGTQTFAGTIINNGTIADDPIGLGASMAVSIGDTQTSSATLSGDGKLTLAESASTISSSDTGDTLTNDTNHTIQGQGTIQNLSSLVNKGTINANVVGGQINLTDLSINNFGGTISASGGATITLTATTISHGNMATQDSSSTIQGDGTIQNLAALINKGTINANDDNGTMLAIQNITSVTNTGTLEATGTGELVLTGVNINNAGGTILNSASQGTNQGVFIDASSVISGGTLEGNIDAATGAELNGYSHGALTLENAGLVYGNSAGAVTIAGTIMATGSTFVGPGLVVGDATNNSATLSGAGALNPNTNSVVSGADVNDTLTNNATIAGGGFIHNLALVNNGTINAVGGPSDVLLAIQDLSSFTNTGTLEATGTGELVLTGVNINNAGGTILNSASQGTNQGVFIDASSVISGGTLEGNIDAATGAELNGYSHGALTLENAGLVYGNSAGAVTIAGTIMATGSTFVGPGLVVGDATNNSATLSGAGALNPNTNSVVSGADVNDTLTNNATIAGGGFIHNLALVNNGTINAVGGPSDVLLAIQDLSSFTNTGTLEATGTGELVLTGVNINNAGGTILNSASQGTNQGVFIDASSVISGGTLEGNIDAATGAELNGYSHGALTLENAGLVYGNSAGAVTIAGTIMATGSTFVGPGLVVGDATNNSATLSGAGALNPNTNSVVSGADVNDTLTNNATIAGGGFIHNLALVNNGTINAVGGPSDVLLAIQDLSSFTNTGTLEATGTGELVLTGVNINNAGGTILNSASQGTNQGVFIDASSVISGGTLEGNIDAATGAELNGYSHGALTLENAGLVYGNSAGAVTIAGTIMATGSTFVGPGLVVGDATNNSATLSGAGALNPNTNSVVSGADVNDTLTNNATIAGGGFIHNLALVNNGTINAVGGPSDVLLAIQDLSSFTNTGTLEATGTGELVLTGVNINNAGGTILNSASQGTNQGVFIDASSVISGGTLEGNIDAATGAELNGYSHGALTLENAGLVYGNSAGAVTIAGTIMATGSTFVGPGLVVGDATNNSATLSGAGALNPNTNSVVSGADVNDTLTNNATIAGGGFIHNLALVNNGTINAVGGPSDVLLAIQDLSSFTNTGTLEATGTGELVLTGVNINNAGGTILNSASQGTNQGVFIDASSVISGGTLEGNIDAATGAELNGYSHGALTLENAGLVYGNSAGAVTIAGTIMATGSTFVGPGLVVGDATNNSATLSGSGELELNLSTVSGALANDTLTNDATIAGGGIIQNLALVNNGTINANYVNGYAIFLKNLSSFTNTGTLEATNGGTLQVNESFSSTGSINVTGGSTMNVTGDLINFGSTENTYPYEITGVTISGGSTLDVTGNLTNDTFVKVDQSHFQVTGKFTNNGLLITDPSNIEFGTLDLEPGSSISATAGDTYLIDTDLIDNDPNTETIDAGLAADLEWETVSLAEGGSLDVIGPGELNIGILDLGADGTDTSLLADINGTGTVTYDPSLNPYLDDATYSLNGGGTLVPETFNVPEPGSLSLLAIGALSMMRRRRSGRA